MVWLIMVWVFPFLVLYAAAMDLLTMQIPNWVSVVGVVAFLGMALVAGMPMSVIAWSIMVSITTFIICFVAFIFHLLGGGDVKLATMIMLWLGWDHFGKFFVIASLYGGLVALVALYLFDNLRYTLMMRTGKPVEFASVSGIPYGVALSAASLHFYLQSPLIKYLI